MRKTSRIRFSVAVDDLSDRRGIIEKLRGAPVQYIWGTPGPLLFMSERKLKAHKKWLEGQGLQIDHIHCMFGGDFDFGDPVPYRRFNVIEAQKALLRKLRATGVDNVVIHCSGQIEDKERKEHLRRFEDSLCHLLPVAEDVGITIAIENVAFEQKVVGTAQEIQKILNHFSSPRVGVCFDTGHANLCEDMKKEFSLLKDRIVTFHIHDNDGKRDIHLPPPHGTIDWIWFAKAVKKMKYQGSFPIETVPQKGTTVKSFIRDLELLFDRPQKTTFLTTNRIIKLR